MEQELSELIGLMEHIATNCIPYPKAGQPNGIIETVYDDITIVYSIFNSYQQPFAPVSSNTANDTEEPQSDTDSQSANKTSTEQQPKYQKSSWSNLLDAYYRATGLTFRSKKLLRRIGMTALLLEAVDEASFAFKAYLEKDKKDKIGEWFRRPGVSETLDLFSINHPQCGDNETVQDVIAVLIASAKNFSDSYSVCFHLLL
jgi:hypothetical protein